jgi:hypothetical protein
MIVAKVQVDPLTGTQRGELNKFWVEDTRYDRFGFIDDPTGRTLPSPPTQIFTFSIGGTAVTATLERYQTGDEYFIAADLSGNQLTFLDPTGRFENRTAIVVFYIISTGEWEPLKVVLLTEGRHEEPAARDIMRHIIGVLDYTPQGE